LLQPKVHITLGKEDFCYSHVPIRIINKFKWKDWVRIKPCTYSQKKLSCVREYQVFLDLFFTSLVDIGTDRMLELDQWNHANALDAEEIMHQTRLHVIKFKILGAFKQNS
jgi:hypothetical protein